MMKKRRLIPAILAAALLAGCTSPLSKEEKKVVTQDKDDSQSTIVPNTVTEGKYYRTLLPYKESASRGLIVSNIYSNYDIQEAEQGLTRISRNVYDPDEYFFQEGQYLDKETVQSWLARRNQSAEGLNPSDKGMSPTERAKKAPVYLAHIIEQDYLKQSGSNKVKLAGISIGLALNSVYYYQKEDYGATYDEPIPDATLNAEGKKIAEKVVKRLRGMDGLANVPITIGLYKQSARGDIVPGTYIAYAEVGEGKSTISDWKNVSEKYLQFPMSNPEDKYREVNDNFIAFKEKIDSYFTNSANIIGTGYYTQDRMQSLKIKIPIKFYGSSEITGFTQYAASEVVKQFPKDLKVEVSITSVNGPEALIVKKSGESETFVHLYNE